MHISAGLFACVLGVAYLGSVCAQPKELRPGDDVELRAMYCTALIRGRLEYVQKRLAELPLDSPIREPWKSLADAQSRNFDRLRSYVGPRLNYIVRVPVQRPLGAPRSIRPSMKNWWDGAEIPVSPSWPIRLVMQDVWRVAWTLTR